MKFLIIILSAFSISFTQPLLNSENSNNSNCYLQLVGIKCLQQEDWTGTDQVYITLDGEKVTTTGRISTGGYIDLTNLDPFRINHDVKLKLWEYDWDADDKLISGSAGCHFKGAGTKHFSGKHGGARYKLYYKVY